MTKYYFNAIMSAGTVENILAEETEVKPLSKKAVSNKLQRKIDSGEEVSRLAEIRMSRGLTQTQLAELSGIAQSSIARIENSLGCKGIEKATMLTGYKLAMALHCRMEEFIDPEKVQ